MMMQHVTSDNTIQQLQIRLSDEIEDSQKRIHPAHATTFNSSMQNKIDLAKHILRPSERYPKMTVKELLYLIDCRIEGEKILLSNCRTTVLSQIHSDNLVNMERIQFIFRKVGKVKWED